MWGRGCVRRDRVTRLVQETRLWQKSGPWDCLVLGGGGSRETQVLPRCPQLQRSSRQLAKRTGWGSSRGPGHVCLKKQR